MSLFELVSVDNNFTYIVEGKQYKRRLITVNVTYRLASTSSATAASTENTHVANKMATDRTFLQYGSTADSVRGLHDIVHNTVFTMEEEFLRDDIWKDHAGRERSAREEWLYVTEGEAVESLGDTRRGKDDEGRDIGHSGWSLADFVRETNAYVDTALAAITDPQQQLPSSNFASNQRLRAATTAVPYHDRRASSTRDVPLAPPHLAREEVIAIRLYTGPAYQPINTFMREVAKIGVTWRKVLARYYTLTYAATAAHLCSGLRKLVTVNDDSKICNLFRGVRGELPEAFWFRDAMEFISAVDFGFMSTSPDKEMSVSFLGQKSHNVLWELQCSPEDSAGYHSAADVQILSQFPLEREVLFPPLTMLRVVEEDVPSKGTEEEMDITTSKNGADTTTHFKFKRVRVVPTFI
jgi:hypothetical protein